MTPIQFPDALPDIRAWLRTSSYTQPLIAGRAFFRIPAKAPKSPFVRLYQSGGGPLPTQEVPMETLRIAIEVWATTGANYPTVRAVERAIKTGTHLMAPGTLLGTGTRVHRAQVNLAVDSPDPDTGWPRRVLDTQWLVTAG